MNIKKPKVRNNDVRTTSSSAKLTTAIIAAAAMLFLAFAYFVPDSLESIITPNPMIFMLMIAGILALLAVLGIILLHRGFKLWSQMKEGAAGSHMQTRIVTSFSLVTIIPTIIISVFSTLFFNYGIQSWFDNKISTAFEKSVIVANAYLEEHKEGIRTDAIAMAGDIKRDLNLAISNPKLFSKILNGQSSLRSLTEAVVIQNGKEIARTRLSFSLIFERLHEEVFERARYGEIIVMSRDDKISALIALDNTGYSFLLISRLVDGNVLDYVAQTRGAADEYHKLQEGILELQIAFSIIFILISLLLLMAVIWYGMRFASQLAIPISRLIKGAEHVRAGDYSIRLPTTEKKRHGKEYDEMSILIDRFNKMVDQLESQRNDLILSHRNLNERRRFIEAVLKGASAGVIAVNPDMQIILCNRSAEKLLQLSENNSYNKQDVTHLLPEISSLLDKVREASTPINNYDTFDDENAEKSVHGEITHETNEKTLNLHVRITEQKTGDKTEGYIITFDNMSALVSAQRRAAWSDVARRIAHEIKNPLTPIQLSVERIRKKYAPDNQEEKEKFFRYLDTISKHSLDIKSMVEEFAAFARMPTPVFRTEKISSIINDAVFSSKTAFTKIIFNPNIDNKETNLLCDAGQIRQVLTNLLKNACESIERALENDKSHAKGLISIDAYKCRAGYIIDIKDNGVGFPPNMMDIIMEPYVTTRAKGTGLGLAIVKKTIEEHNGTISIANCDEGGARITITLPL